MVREAMAQYLEEQASWHDQKAEALLGEPRHLRSADGLRELAAFVRALPENSLVLTGLARNTFYQEGQLFRPLMVTIDTHDAGGWLARMVLSFRFDNPDERCDRFMTRLLEASLSDRLIYSLRQSSS